MPTPLPVGTPIADQHLFTNNHPMLVGLSYSRQNTKRIRHTTDAVKLDAPGGPSLAYMQNQMWAIMPTENNGYNIRSSRNDGEYLGVQNCQTVRTQTEPYMWGIGMKGNEMTVQARECGPKYLAVLDDDIVGLSASRESWLASNILAGKKMYE